MQLFRRANAKSRSTSVRSLLLHRVFSFQDNLFRMKVLAVTGRMAQDLAKKSSIGADVLVLDVDIAAFITPDMLHRAAPKGYDLILIPGAITANFSAVEAALGTKIRLGPKHAADIGFVLRHLEEVELSTSIPACTMLESRMKRDALAMLEKLESEAEATMTIRGIKIAGGSRMKVLAEVVDATKQNVADLAQKISYFQSQGADMIDLGVSLDATPEQVARTVRAAREITDLPISVDTVSSELIRSGLEAGADMVLSLNGDNIPLVGVAVAAAGVPAVVIPGPRPSSLEENILAAQALGIKVIADPVLSPPLQGLARSIESYIDFAKINPKMPLFFGAGNVTELLDADSPGANALLAAIGGEVGASILFTPEYSDKAQGSVHELRIASEMMFLARERKTPPKDLGIDLLVLKDKRKNPTGKISENCIEAKADHKYVPDPAGYFKIEVADGKIVAIHEHEHEKLEVASCSARDLLNTLIDFGLVTRLDHAGYLGYELEKAEMALRLGRSYNQDEPLIPDKD
jgi:dihydropteroate synthase-like protein